MNYYDAPGTGNLLLVGAKRYQLTQFHFHRPSEEYIHGKPYDMVAHLMYQASDGKVAGVAVLLKAGSANATIQQIWEHMPQTESKVLTDFSHKEEAIAGVDINPEGGRSRSFTEGGQRERDHSADLGTYAPDREQGVN